MEDVLPKMEKENMRKPRLWSGCFQRRTVEQLQQLLSAPPAEREAYFNRQYFCLLLRMAEECDKSLCHLCVCVCVC